MNTFKTSLGAFLVTMILLQARAQKVCDPYDEGPYLGTKPTLQFTVNEATAEDIQASETAGDMKFYAELRLVGEVGRDFTIQIQSSGFVDPLAYFTPVNEDGSNYLKLTRPLDRDGATSSLEDDTNIINFVLTCTPTDASDPRQVYDASLIVKDVNDNDPVFASHDSVTLSEDTPPGTVVARLSATDKDLNLDTPLDFSLMHDFGKFSINNMTGDILLDSHINYEAMTEEKSYNLTVLVEDGGPEMTRSATAAITVHVTDADDQGPVFVYDGCVMLNGRCAWPSFEAKRTLKKDEAINFKAASRSVSSSVQIKARDQDGHEDRTIRFRIASTLPAGEENKFRVETSPGSNRGEFLATVRANSDVTVAEGFQILLAAEEESENKRTVVALLHFTETGSGSSSAQGGSGSDDRADSHYHNDDYTETEVALIIATSILAAFLLCALIAIIYVCRRSDPGRNNDLPMAVHTNNGFSS